MPFDHDPRKRDEIESLVKAFFRYADDALSLPKAEHAHETAQFEFLSRRETFIRKKLLH